MRQIQKLRIEHQLLVQTIQAVRLMKVFKTPTKTFNLRVVKQVKVANRTTTLMALSLKTQMKRLRQENNRPSNREAIPLTVLWKLELLLQQEKLMVSRLTKSTPINQLLRSKGKGHRSGSNGLTWTSNRWEPSSHILRSAARKEWLRCQTLMTSTKCRQRSTRPLLKRMTRLRAWILATTGSKDCRRWSSRSWTPSLVN